MNWRTVGLKDKYRSILRFKERKSDIMRKFNWDYLYFKIKEKGYTITYYSAKILNRHQSYLQYYKTRNEAPPQNVITYMIKNLELDENTLWQIDEPKEEATEPNVVLEKVADTSAGAVVCEVVEPDTTETVEESEEQVIRYMEMPRYMEMSWCVKMP